MYILSAHRNSIGQNLTPIKDKNPPQTSKRLLAQSNAGHLPRNKQTKNTVNLIFNGETQSALNLKLRKRKRRLFSPLLFNIVLEWLVVAIRQKTKYKKHKIWMRRSNLSLSQTV